MINWDTFHFIRPLALLGVLLLPIMVVLLHRIQSRQTAWRSILPAHLCTHLLSEKGQQRNNLTYWLLAIIWCLASVALAGPTWEKLPQPVYQTQSGKVIVLDMSLSMQSTDIYPNRLTRARFKALDLMEKINEGEVGLVAYAGDAFVISPLTTDSVNINNLIPSLSPEIMPVLGSNPFAGLNKAAELLENAGYSEGDIYWITDGIDFIDIELVREFSSENAFRISTLLVGTSTGAPITLSDGTLLRDNNGNVVVPKLNVNYFQQALSNSRTRITRMTNDARDIDAMILPDNLLNKDVIDSNEQMSGDIWKDMGAYLVLLILPLVAFFFRKGSVLTLLFVAILVHPNTGYVNELESEVNTGKPSSLADKIMLNANQRGQKQYNNGRYQEAFTEFDNSSWKAASAYKSGDYETALSLYAGLEGIDNVYNKGNALAKLGKLDEAINAYDEVLNEDPNHKNAAINKEILEQLKQQQENQQQDQNQQNSDQQDSEEQNSENQENESSNQDQSQSQNDADKQSSQQQQQQQQQQSSAQNDPEQQQSEAEQPSESEQNQNDEQQENTDTNPDSVVKAQDLENLSPEEREKLRQMQMLMNKIPDDPAFLLRRKMLLESQRRKQQGAPLIQQQSW